MTLSYSTSKLVGNVIAAILAIVVVGFGVAFGYLIYSAFSLVDTSIGLTTSFTGYEYISILATFFFLILYGGYYVFRSAFRRPVIEIDVME